MSFLLNFWNQYKNQIIPIYKGSSFIWGLYSLDKNTNARIYRPIKLVHVIEQVDDKIYDLVVINVEQKIDSEIFIGLPIFDKSGGLYTPHTNGNLNNYTCDSCQKTIDIGVNCESCDFDLCDACVESGKKHNHSMFKMTGYYGVNTYDKNTCVEELIIPI